ncbi:MAG TPA: sodium:solute symporter family protein [Chitinispirillaceae bacterium]|nr:sodium:solute symporter family protein [Chitinispirillaceae bacterium]
MNTILIIVVIFYLLTTALLGYIGYRQTKSTADYLLAGRKVHPVVMAISYGATFISTSAIIGFGGAAAVYGMGVLWLTVLNIFIGIFIAFAIFGKRTRKMGHNLDAHTFPEFIGKRFQSPFLQWASGLLIFVAMPLYAGAVIIGGAQFITETLHINYEMALLCFVSIVALYVVMGGLKGVMYTDAFQGTIMFIGMALLLIFTYVKLGGVIKAHEALTALKPEAVKIFGAMGHQGWTSMPQAGSVFWWQLVSTVVMGVGIGVLAQPQLIVRFMTVKSNREINRAVLIGGVFIFMMTGVAFIVGALTNVYFHKTLGKIAIVAVSKKTDSIIPLFINSAMPQWFTAVFMVTLLAAAMSTLSSQFHTMGSAFGRDFLEYGMKIKTKSTILTTKIAMLFAICISALLAYVLPNFFEQGTAIIAVGTAIFFGLCAAAFLPLYFGALYIKATTRQSAIACFVSGAMVSAFWIFFVHIKESKPLGICKALFGVDSLASSVLLQNIDPIIVSLPVSILVTIIVSMMTKAPDKDHLQSVFSGVITKV